MNEPTLFDEPQEGTENLLPMDGDVRYYPNFFNREESDILFKQLSEEVPWKQETITIYDKTMNIPRLTAWYGDVDKAYTYSGIQLKPHPWSDVLLEMKRRLDVISNATFNSVLLNMYRTGNDSVAWHSDDEKELGENPIIASVSFGATRTFKLRHLEDKNSIVSIDLAHGSLVVMSGETQHKWEHEVPKTSKKAVWARINLTFRTIK